MLSYLQAIVMGLLQGITELFPISSLGHAVIAPTLFGPSWHNLATAQAQPHGPFLPFLVALHVATALALVVYYRRDWARILRGLLRSIVTRRISSPSERLAWLLVVGTIPVGIAGLAAEHPLERLFAKPFYASVFLAGNGVLLGAGELLRRRNEARGRRHMVPKPGHNLHRSDHPIGLVHAGGIGVAQSLALFAGISRTGVTMTAGLAEGLDHEDAARFAFLLSAPIILAAGVLELPRLASVHFAAIRGQVLVGALCAGVAAYLATAFLTRWFKARTLWPFAIYCLVAGTAAAIHFR